LKPLANKNFDPSLPVQTPLGARQALRVGHNKVNDLIGRGLLKVVYFGRSRRITTDSILNLATTGEGRRRREAATAPARITA
jgi:hypothetical protein